MDSTSDVRLSRHHIVRVNRRRYWVGIEREGVIATVVPVGLEAPEGFLTGRA